VTCFDNCGVVYLDEMRANEIRRSTRLANDAAPRPADTDMPEQESKSAKSINSVAGFVFVMILIGATAAFAWHAYDDLVARQIAQARDAEELRAAVHHLEISMGRRMHEMQLTQQRAEQSNQTVMQRLVEQAAALNKELERLTKSPPGQSVKRQNSTGGTSSKSGSTVIQPVESGIPPAGAAARAPATRAAPN
jgi:E3 ubiquitin-protein ligase DOA10